jgi:hypothetical protein
MEISRLTRSQTFAGILLFGLLAMTARNAVDPDLWWHLRTGQWIMDTGHIPRSDPFSFTRSGNPWVAHEWLSEVAFYEIWKYSGFAGLIIFAALVTTAGFMLLYLRSPGKPHWAAAILLLGALAAAPVWGVRPQMFTFALASLLLWLLERGQKRPRLLIWIPPLFLLWINLHAGFALGPVLLTAYGAGLVWEVAAGDTPWQEARPYLLRIALALTACVVLVPLNPSGVQLYRYPLDVLRSAAMRSVIIEWFPPDFHQLRYLPLFLIWSGLLWALATSRSCFKARALVPLFLTFLAALDAVRHIPLLVLVATPVIAGAFRGVSSWSQPSWAQPLSSSSVRQSQFVFRGAVLLLMAGFALTRWTSLIRNQVQAEAELYPAKAMEFLRSHKLPSRLFVYYDWGGYAIWRLYPEYRVFVDGRADLYGDDLLNQFQDSAQLRAGWEQVLDRWGVQAVLMPPSGPLAQGLLLDARWHSVYRDSQAILFLATDSPLKVSSYQESASLGHKKVKKCVPEPSESAKLHETGAVPTAQRGYETATSRAISKRHSVGLGLCQQTPGWLGVGCGKHCSVRDFDPNLEDLNDKRSWQTNVAQ